MSLHSRIAEALGWTVQETQQFSFQSLREIVRPVSPKLVHELDERIRSGRHITMEDTDEDVREMQAAVMPDRVRGDG